MNSVRLYYIIHAGEDDLAQIDAILMEKWLAQLSTEKKASIQRLLHVRNRLSSLIGLRLLYLCAQDEGVADFRLSDVRYPESGKPFWHHVEGFFDFNISHSGNMILVAVSTSSKLGVDVEQFRELKRLSFKMVLSPEELSEIELSPPLFFDLWSKKEAVVKAADTAGLSRMRDVKLAVGSAMLDKKTWYLKALDLDKGYAVNMASAEPVDNLKVQQIQLTQLK